MTRPLASGLHRRSLLKTALAAPALLGLRSFAFAENGQPVRGGTLLFGLARDPLSLVSFFTPNNEAITVSPKITDGLLTLDADLNPVPQLATSWDISPDGREYTFHLRQNVRWHDGQPFTAADVEFSLKASAELHSRGRITLGAVTDYVIADDHTITLKLSAPTPFLLLGLIPNEVPIIPRHLYEGTDLVQNPYNSSPVGTGPFRFVKWERGSHIEVERNEDYWGEHTAWLDRIIFRVIPDPGARAVAFETGEIDVAGWNPVAISDLPRLEALGNIAVSTEGYTYRPNVFQIEFNLQDNVLSDVRVRRALAHAVDRQAIVDRIFLGKGIAHFSPVSPYSKAYYKEEPGYGYDPEKSAALLDEAGLTADASGKRFDFVLDYPTDRLEYRQISEFVRASLAKIGVEVSLRTLDPSARGAAYKDGLKWFAQMTAQTNMIDPALGIVRFYRTVPAEAKAKPHWGGYSNPVVDDLLARAISENDATARAALWQQFQDIAVEDFPRFYILTSFDYSVLNTRLKNGVTYIDGVRGDSYSEAWIAS